MDDLIEFILELILEGVIDLSSCKKLSKWIRYPLIFIVSTLCLIVILLILISAISISDKSIILSIVFIIIDLILLVYGIKKIKVKYIKYKNKKRL